MATIIIKLSLFLFFLILLSSSLIHGRESQFFAKVSNNIPKETTQLTPIKQSQPLNTNQQQQPNFIPQADEGGAYGLFGHESGQLPPSTTTPATTNGGDGGGNLPADLPENYNPVAYTTPIHSSTQNMYNGDSSTYNTQKQDKFLDGENMYNSQKQGMWTNGGNMYNTQKQDEFLDGENMYNSEKQGMYNTQKQGMSDTRFMENGRYYHAGDMYNTQKQGMTDTRFMDNGKYYHAGDMYNSQRQGMGEAKFTETDGGSMYNIEKKGMSDTRFLENGKYYYDLNNENFNVNSRGFDSKNGYNTRGYYGNNNDNTYDRYNSNGGYETKEEYQENQEDKFNP